MYYDILVVSYNLHRYFKQPIFIKGYQKLTLLKKDDF
jgi:hypothetical protein